jgi:hypothetical protein
MAPARHPALIAKAPALVLATDANTTGGVYCFGAVSGFGVEISLALNFSADKRKTWIKMAPATTLTP